MSTQHEMSENELERIRYLVNSGAVTLMKNGDFRIDWSVAADDAEFQNTVQTMSAIRQLERERQEC